MHFCIHKMNVKRFNVIFFVMFMNFSVQAGSVDDLFRNSICKIGLCSDAISLKEFSSIESCSQFVVTRDDTAKALYTTCNILYSEHKQSSAWTVNEYRKNLLCLRHRLPSAKDREESRTIVKKCGEAYPSAETSRMALWYSNKIFPTQEQMELDAQKERQEAMLDQLKSEQRNREYQQRMNEINRNYKNEIDKINQNEQLRLLELNSRRPINCTQNGTNITCY